MVCSCSENSRIYESINGVRRSNGTARFLTTWEGSSTSKVLMRSGIIATPLKSSKDLFAPLTNGFEQVTTWIPSGIW